MHVHKTEYILLRLARRFLFSTTMLEKIGAIIPYYRQNLGLSDPFSVVAQYVDCAERYDLNFTGKTVLELGPGATNSTAYALATLGCRKVYAVEPFTRFDERLDRKALGIVADRSGITGTELARKTVRLADIDSIPEQSIDVIVSHSVLEHVADPVYLFRTLAQKMLQDGCMIHIVDYRDHFFKYPYHLLLFSKKIWRKWLDPGDLPGWRYKDHRRMLGEAGFRIIKTNSCRDLDHFNLIKNNISDDYNRSDPTLSYTICTIIVKKK